MSAGDPGRHWWSLAPIPTFSQTISARRAYIEAIGVYLIFFAPSIVAAAAALGNYNPPNPESWWVTGSSGLQEVTQAVLAVVVVLLLAQRRGRRPADVGLVLAQAKGGPGVRQAIRMAAWAALAFFVGSIITSALATGNFPFGHVNVANTVLEISSAANAGVMEEVVVLAFLVTTLEQAGRRRWEIAAVALVCRGAYHIYYGPGAIGILLWAAVFLWLFWRFRSVVPMIITHICWDTIVFLIQVSSGFEALFILGLLALEILAVIMWLVDRSDRPAPGPMWAGGTWNGPPWGQTPPGQWSSDGQWIPGGRWGPSGQRTPPSPWIPPAGPPAPYPAPSAPAGPPPAGQGPPAQTSGPRWGPPADGDQASGAS